MEAEMQSENGIEVSCHWVLRLGKSDEAVITETFLSDILFKQFEHK